MPSIPVGFALVKFEFSAVGLARPMCTTLGFGRHDGDPDPLDPTTLANDVARRFGTVFPKTVLGTQWNFQGCSAYVQEMVDSQSVGHSDADTAFGGTWNQGTPPANSAMLVEKHTDRGGKRYRGRCYFPPCYISAGKQRSDGFLDGGEFQENQIRLDNFFGSLVTAGEGRGYQPMLFHGSPDESEISIFPTAIRALVLDRQLATQRKRMR
jgi:hypothetical protein